jgi:hypothetical protein
MDTLVADLETKLASARLGGGKKARQRMKWKEKLSSVASYVEMAFDR